jgi:hypothetical protein
MPSSRSCASSGSLSSQIKVSGFASIMWKSNGAVDLADAARLLRGCLADSGNDVRYTLYAVDDVGHRAARGRALARLDAVVMNPIAAPLLLAMVMFLVLRAVLSSA